jgi:hypothetical protein
MPGSSAVSGTPRLLRIAQALWNTGSTAFAGDDTRFVGNKKAGAHRAGFLFDEGESLSSASAEPR